MNPYPNASHKKLMTTYKSLIPVDIPTVGNRLHQPANEYYELFMFVDERIEDGTKILFLYRYNTCQGCYGYEPSKIPFGCSKCKYVELPMVFKDPNHPGDLTPEQYLSSRTMNFAETNWEKMKEEGIKVYRLEKFSYNVNFSKLIFLPMSRVNSRNENEYDVMIYQEDYHGKLHELVARPMGYTTLYHHRELTLEYVDLYDVSNKNSLNLDHVYDGQINLLARYFLEKFATSSGFYNSIHQRDLSFSTHHQFCDCDN